MPLKQVSIGGTPVWIEVTEIETEGRAAEGDGGRFENTSVADRVGDLADTIRDLIGAVKGPVEAAFAAAKPEEWSLELNIGFKAETGLPFIAKGEANAAVKVTAKWK